MAPTARTARTAPTARTARTAPTARTARTARIPPTAPTAPTARIAPTAPTAPTARTAPTDRTAHTAFTLSTPPTAHTVALTPPTAPTVPMANGNRNPTACPDNLILVITHFCNLECSYCPVIKERKAINKRTAELAADIFLSYGNKDKHIRLFGGEPLLEFNLVKETVNFAKAKAAIKRKKITFDLSTNATLLNDAMFKFFRKNPELELIISLDGDRHSHTLNRVSLDKSQDAYAKIIENIHQIHNLPNVTINQVVCPNQVKLFFSNFRHILSLGFKRFNFLPAYFIHWKASELKVLESEFKKIAGLIKDRADIYVKNLFLLSETPLFNNGFVVDYNGDIFPNNLVLSKLYAHLGPQLKVGNVADYSKKRLKSEDFFIPRQDLNAIKDKQLLNSAGRVDNILTNFVASLKK